MEILVLIILALTVLVQQISIHNYKKGSQTPWRVS